MKIQPEPAQAGLDPADPPLLMTDIRVSADFPKLLQRLRFSFAFSSYQTGQLFLVGVQPDGAISVSQQNYFGAMGLSWSKGRLFLATQTQIWRLENLLLPGELGDHKNDAVLVPRQGWTTGYLDTHEIAIGTDDHPIFVATKFNCLGTIDERLSFKLVWKPNFISDVVPEDRCHINGLALDDGVPAYVTVTGKSDQHDGWREHRVDQGLVIDCRTNHAVAIGLSMPHSPRLHDGKLWLLESGRGYLVQIDLATGAKTDIAFCPGFARGLSFGDGYALVTISKPRDAKFHGLPLDGELEKRKLPAMCGVLIIDLESPRTIGWLALEGNIDEVFDVAALPNIQCPVSLGLNTREILINIRASH